MKKNQPKSSGLKQENLMMTLQFAVMLEFREAEVLLAFPQDLRDRGEEDQDLETLATDPVEEEEEHLP